MGDPYDLSEGNKGFRYLARTENIRRHRTMARYLRAFNSMYDSMDLDIAKLNRKASELEKKAFELETRARMRRKRMILRK